MVRLKGRLQEMGGNEKRISIPYGAIKSADFDYSYDTPRDFNSLWCD